MKPSSPRGPLLPGEASTILTFVVALVGLGGVINLVLVAIGLVSLMLDPRPAALGVSSVVSLLVVVGINVGYCLAGLWLHQGRRRGAYLAIGGLVLNLLNLLDGPGRPHVLDFLVPAAALVGVVLAWPHLSDDGREVEVTLRVTPRPGATGRRRPDARRATVR